MMHVGILVILVILVVFLLRKTPEYFESDSAIVKVMAEIKKADKQGFGLDQFRANLNMPKFNAYTFGVLLNDYREGQMTHEKTADYLIGDFL